MEEIEAPWHFPNFYLIKGQAIDGQNQEEGTVFLPISLIDVPKKWIWIGNNIKSKR